MGRWLDKTVAEDQGILKTEYKNIGPDPPIPFHPHPMDDDEDAIVPTLVHLHLMDVDVIIPIPDHPVGFNIAAAHTPDHPQDADIIAHTPLHPHTSTAVPPLAPLAL